MQNYIEPFLGSAAVLLLRPHPPRIETANDLDCMVANFWRATQQDPEAVVVHADSPVNECDLHARHRYLVLSGDATVFRQRMKTDPDYFDARMAGWWCWGLCCWIGGGWCQTAATAQWKSRPTIANPNDQGGHGVNGSLPKSKVRIAGHNPGSVGKGVHAQGDTLSQQMPYCDSRGVLSGGNRPQLADAHSRGRGVHANDAAGTCAERRAWLLDWFGRLRDRLRNVRVCCGDWLRVCDSPSVTTRLGLTGIFFDPPYSKAAKRAKGIYASDSETVADDVRRYCLERGSDPLMRLVLAGYEGEGHEVLEQHGWTAESWVSNGGYGNCKGNQNRKKERLWFSPHCCRERTLFSEETPDV